MGNEIEEFDLLFRKIVNLGWVKSNRRHNTGVGKTLEDLMEIQENNLSQPDFKNIEIKSQRDSAQSLLTLFTKSPSEPSGANRLLRDKFGISTESNPEIKKLHVSIFANRFTNCYGLWGMKIKIDNKKNQIKLVVKNLENDQIEETDIFYTFSDLKSKLFSKLQYLVFVNVKSKKIDGVEYFKFYDYSLFSDVKWEKFLNLIEQGIIMYDIRIGTYKSGSKRGKPHDHGSGFRIPPTKLTELYTNFEPNKLGFTEDESFNQNSQNDSISNKTLDDYF